MPVWDGNPPEVGVRVPGGLDPRPQPRPATVQTALPQSPRCQVGCVDVPDPLLQAARLTGGKRCSDAVCGPGRRRCRRRRPRTAGDDGLGERDGATLQPSQPY